MIAWWTKYINLSYQNICKSISYVPFVRRFTCGTTFLSSKKWHAVDLSLSLSLSSSFKKSHKIEIFNAPPLFQFYFSPVNELFDKDGLMTFFNMLFKPFFFSLGIRND